MSFDANNKMSETDNSRSLILRPDLSLASVTPGSKRILTGMVAETLALARESAVKTIDLDALVREGKRLQRNKQGMTPEDIRAFQLFHQAAVAGHPEAQLLVFYCYRDGHGVRADVAKALEWLHTSAESGFADAQCALGYCYKQGQGIPENYAEAVKWFRKAAEKGEPYAQNNLGYCYERGQGVPQDYAEAVKWFGKTAEKGDDFSQYNLGLCYKNGRGVEIDMPRAYAWFQLAADNGYGFAKGEATGLAALMSPSEFDAASEIYQEFKEKYSAER